MSTLPDPVQSSISCENHDVDYYALVFKEGKLKDLRYSCALCNSAPNSAKLSAIVSSSPINDAAPSSTSPVSPAMVLSGPIRDGIANGDLATIKVLLKSNPTFVSSRDEFGRTPLHLAAAAGHEEIVELLLESGADVNARADEGLKPYSASGAPKGSVIYIGPSALYDAATAGHWEIAELLVAHGADYTPLCGPTLYSARAGDLEKVQKLVGLNSQLAFCQNSSGVIQRKCSASGFREISSSCSPGLTPIGYRLHTISVVPPFLIISAHT